LVITKSPDTPDDDNFRTRMSGGESPIHGYTLKSGSTMDSSKPYSTPTDGTSTDGESIEQEPPPIFNPTELISFLMDKQEDGQQVRGRIVELIEDHESKLEDNPGIKFRISVNEDQAEDIINYNKMLEYIIKDDESDIMWKSQCFVSHEYKGSQCYVMIEWENGEMTLEPL
jgi:hypothetical protein